MKRNDKMKGAFCKCDKCHKEESMLTTMHLPNDNWAELGTFGNNQKFYQLCPQCKAEIISIIEKNITP
jgi:hypothetical protein